MRRRKKKNWSESVGEYGNRVRVTERANGIIYAEVKTADDTYRRISLGHRDRETAVQWAKDEVARRQLKLNTVTDRTPTVARVFAAYLTYRTPKKSASRQQYDHRAALMWTRVLGSRFDLSTFPKRKWDQFIDERGSGAIDAEGNLVPTGKRAAVRARTVEVDCRWLTAVINWATSWREEHGYLMTENSIRGFDIPSEKNPRRPVASQDRFEKVMAKAKHVTMQIQWTGKRCIRRSYLPELLEIVNGTGRRISAVLNLRRDDLRLDSTPSTPHGAIQWPARTDKMGKEWSAPISTAVRNAIDRLLALQQDVEIISPFLLPSPRNSNRPLSKRLASRWLEKAEQMAKAEKQQGGLWHPYRRKFATERKHWADVDVCAAGGWSDVRSLKMSYQQADAATILKVITEPAALREAE